MITRIDPEQYQRATTVQVESDAPTNVRAVEEVEDWAAANGFVRTSEFAMRRALVGGELRFRGICFRLTDEELAAAHHMQQRMIERGEALQAITDADNSRQLR